MRTYEDTFSGQKIYPGKVRFAMFHSGAPHVDIPSPRYYDDDDLHVADGIASRQLRG
jgi:hypothetical protein